MSEEQRGRSVALSLVRGTDPYTLDKYLDEHPTTRMAMNNDPEFLQLLSIETDTPLQDSIDDYISYLKSESVQEEKHFDIDLSRAVSEGNKKLAKKILKHLKSNGELNTEILNNALISAAFNGQHKTVKLLVKWGATELEKAAKIAEIAGHVSVAEHLREMEK